MPPYILDELAISGNTVRVSPKWRLDIKNGDFWLYSETHGVMQYGEGTPGNRLLKGMTSGVSSLDELRRMGGQGAIAALMELWQQEIILLGADLETSSSSASNAGKGRYIWL